MTRRVCLVAAFVLLLVVGVLSAGASDSVTVRKDGSVIVWGCRGSGVDDGQCRVPASAKSGVIAIAAGSTHSLALKKDGSVVAWGCGGGNDYGQCRVPASAKSGVIAISAAAFHSLALKAGR